MKIFQIKNSNALERTLFTGTVILGLVCAWVFRQTIISDGISYLDLGDAYLRGDWAAAANAYWSPLYPYLLGAAMRILHPPAWWEFPALHAVNFCIYMFALLCFRFFVQSVLMKHNQEEREMPVRDFFALPEWALWILGYGLFLWSSLNLITIAYPTPDLLVSAWLFLYAGLLIRVRENNSLLLFGAMGIVLGAAYLTKGVMFPLAFVFLLITLVSGKLSWKRVSGVSLAGVIFLTVSSPLLLLLSHAKGRITYGDTGKIAYAALVGPGVPQMHWQGGPYDEVPLHPTRKILDHPPVFEFAEPVAGTFPPWYDPSYWNDGLKVHFRLRTQVHVLVTSSVNYLKMLASQAGLVAGILILVFLGRQLAIKGILRNWPLIAVSLTAICLYSFVLVLPRYVGGFLILLLFSIIAAVRLPKQKEVEIASTYIVIAIAMSMAITIAQPLLDAAYHQALGGSASAKEQITAAQELTRLGLKPGDRVAIIGEGITDYWARIARVKIVAQIMPLERGGDEFLDSSQDRKELVYKLMANTGARALIMWNASHYDFGPGWIEISGTSYRVRYLH